MIRVKCPYCGEENKVGLIEIVRAGEPTPMEKTCSDFVSFSPTRYVGAHYVEQAFGLDFATTPGSYSQ